MGRFYRVRTFHRSVITENTNTGCIESIPEEHTSSQRPILIGYCSDHRRDACFLISSQSNTLHLEPSQSNKGVIALGSCQNAANEVSLFDRATGLWLCATLLDGSPVPKGRIVAAVRAIDSFERFTFLPLASVFVPSSAIPVSERLDALLAQPLTLDAVLSVATEDAPLLNAVGMLASRATLMRLSSDLLASPSSCQAFTRLFPNDLFAKHGLPVLARQGERQDAGEKPTVRGGWIERIFSKRQPVKVATMPSSSLPLGPEFDQLVKHNENNDYISLPYACNAIARSRFIPYKSLCIIATARNEGIYLLDWIAYHRSIGIEQFFIYTNNNDDGSDVLLKCLADAKIIDWRRSELTEGGNAQMKAYGHALSLNADVLDYRWALIIDLDEYFVFNHELFRSAHDFFDWHESGTAVDALALNWIVHGSSGQACWKDEFIGRRFAFPVEALNLHIKTACRPQKFIHSNPHHPKRYRNAAFSFHSANGDIHKPYEPGNWSLSAQPNADFAWINHYFFKSAEEFLWKWSRNRGDHAMTTHPSITTLPSDFVHSFMMQHSMQQPVRSTVDQCAPAFDAELARLKSLPGVESAWSQVKQHYLTRIRDIVPMFSKAPGIMQAGEDGKAFLALLNR